MTKFITTLFCMVLLTSNIFCQNPSSIFISSKSKGLLQYGYGTSITIVNLESGNLYMSKSLGGLTSHSYIDEVPEGEYLVVEMIIPLGSHQFTYRSQELRDYFDTLYIESGSVNYLGDFFAIKEVGNRNMRLSANGRDIPNKLIEKACRKGLTNQETDWTKHYPYKEQEWILR